MTATKTIDLLAIAERCEKADGPEPLLDAQIVALRNNAMVKPYPPQTDFGPGQKWQFWSLDGLHFLANESHAQFKVLPVTASLDAAMTLVPEGLFPLLDWSGVHCRLRSRHGGELRDVSKASALAVTPALALCAAALRAMEASNGQS